MARGRPTKRHPWRVFQGLGVGVDSGRNYRQLPVTRCLHPTSSHQVLAINLPLLENTHYAPVTKFLVPNPPEIICQLSTNFQLPFLPRTIPPFHPCFRRWSLRVTVPTTCAASMPSKIQTYRGSIPPPDTCQWGVLMGTTRS